MPAPPPEQLALFAMRCPPMTGSENLTPAILADWWDVCTSTSRNWPARPKVGCRAAGSAEPGVAHGGAGDVSPGGEQEGPGPAVRVHGDVYEPAVRGRAAAASCRCRGRLQEYAGAGNREALL